MAVNELSQTLGDDAVPSTLASLMAGSEHFGQT